MKRRRATSDRAFTLLELLIAIAIGATLMGLVVPALFGALDLAREINCASNLRQLGLAVQLYLKDSGGYFFPIRFPNDPATAREEGRSWYFGCEVLTDWRTTPEGERVLDRTQALLHPYVQDYGTVEVCPSFDYGGAYQPKFRGTWWTYGVNKVLSPDRYADPSAPLRHRGEIAGADAPRVVVFADAAEVARAAAPATGFAIREWHYVQPRGGRFTDYPHVHFRHGGRANVLFADWHVAAVEPAAESLDARLPGARIGFFDENEILFEPRGGP